MDYDLWGWIKIDDNRLLIVVNFIKLFVFLDINVCKFFIGKRCILIWRKCEFKWKIYLDNVIIKSIKRFKYI